MKKHLSFISLTLLFSGLSFSQKIKPVLIDVNATTETGLKSILDTTWGTETLLKALKTEKLQLRYVQVWRNDITSPANFYAPFRGQVSKTDFIKFYNDSYTLFDKDFKNIYK